MESSTEELIDSNNESFENSPERRKYRGLALEPAALLLYFAIDLSGTIFQNQIIYQTCTQVFEYNQSECILLGTAASTQRTKEIEIQVQPYAANIFMVRSVIDCIIPALGIIFIGAWSDIFGRKPIIVTALLGLCSMYVLWAILGLLSIKYSISPWYYILVMLPKVISGSSCSFKCISFSYISDVTDDNSRGFRMALYESFLYVGIVTGYLSSSAVFHATNAVVVFAISGVTIFLATLLIIFGLEESVVHNEMNETSSVGGLFRWTLVEEMFDTCFKRRSRYDRAVLWLIILTLTLNIFVVDGSANVFFLFVREKFAWTIKDYTYYQALSIFIQIVGNTLLVYALQKFVGASVLTIAILSYGSYVLDSVIKGTSRYSWELYVAAAIGILRGAPGPMCRSVMATLAPASETGKIFSFTSALQALTPLASAPIYTELYSRTLEFSSGLFNLVSAGFYAICFIFLTIVFGIFKSYTYRGTRDFTEA